MFISALVNLTFVSRISFSLSVAFSILHVYVCVLVFHLCIHERVSERERESEIKEKGRERKEKRETSRERKKRGAVEIKEKLLRISFTNPYYLGCFASQAGYLSFSE